MNDTFTYEIGPATYVNLTNRCTNDCTFCVRNTADGVGGYDLRLADEPTGADVIAALVATRPTDVVFCGFGEPTLNLEALLEAAQFVHSYGGHVRVNTNGHANLVHGRNVVPQLAGLVDEVSISLNAPDRDTYAEIARCGFGPEGFDALVDFAEKCRDAGIGVTLTVVDVLSPEQLEDSRRFAEDLAVQFRVRPYVA